MATLTRDATYSGIYYLIYTRIKRLAAKSELFDPKSSYYFASCALVSSQSITNLINYFSNYK
jgi:hypothetical protein